MAEFTVWDWFWWLLGFVVLPVALFAVNQWRSHRTYREIRRSVSRIGTGEGSVTPEEVLLMHNAYSEWLVNDAQARDDDGEPQRAAFSRGYIAALDDQPAPPTARAEAEGAG